jgi:hypothetical protein
MVREVSVSSGTYGVAKSILVSMGTQRQNRMFIGRRDVLALWAKTPA